MEIELGEDRNGLLATGYRKVITIYPSDTWEKFGNAVEEYGISNLLTHEMLHIVLDEIGEQGASRQLDEIKEDVEFWRYR